MMIWQGRPSRSHYDINEIDSIWQCSLFSLLFLVIPCWPLLALVGPCWPLLALVGPCWPLLAPVGPYWPPVGPCQTLLALVGPCWPLLANIVIVFCFMYDNVFWKELWYVVFIFYASSQITKTTFIYIYVYIFFASYDFVLDWWSFVSFSR